MKKTALSVWFEWKEFWRMVKPANASDIQRKEMRRAFYAGNNAMLHMVQHIADVNDEDAGAAELQKLDNELNAFKKDVTEGRA